MTLTMAGFGYSVALALAAIFAFSASGKIAWHRETRATFARLGLPRPDVFALAVPAVELLVAVVLIAFPVVGAALALVVLAAFTAFLARQLQQGTEAPCGCFGSPRDTTPLSLRALVRNAELAALSVLALFAEPTLPSAAEMAVAALLVIGGWLAFRLTKTPEVA